MTLLCLRTVWGVLTNTTTVESWEKDRHEALLRRARPKGGFLPGPDGQQIRITRQEFPWDVGIFANIAQAMGSANPLVWFWPLAANLSLYGGLTFPDNGHEEPGITWPPPDPDKMAARNYRRPDPSAQPFMHDMDRDAFRQRQQSDQLRQRYTYPEKEVPGCGEISTDVDYYADNMPSEDDPDDDTTAYKTWRNNEGESLGDLGVDEDTEARDEDDIPLAELLRRSSRAKNARDAHLQS